MSGNDNSIGTIRCSSATHIIHNYCPVNINDRVVLNTDLGRGDSSYTFLNGTKGTVIANSQGQPDHFEIDLDDSDIVFNIHKSDVRLLTEEELREESGNTHSLDKEDRKPTLQGTESAPEPEPEKRKEDLQGFLIMGIVFYVVSLLYTIYLAWLDDQPEHTLDFTNILMNICLYFISILMTFEYKIHKEQSETISQHFSQIISYLLYFIFGLLYIYQIQKLHKLQKYFVSLYLIILIVLIGISYLSIYLNNKDFDNTLNIFYPVICVFPFIVSLIIYYYPQKTESQP